VYTCSHWYQISGFLLLDFGTKVEKEKSTSGMNGQLF
jgi:hypothetical protein